MLDNRFKDSIEEASTTDVKKYMVNARQVFPAWSGKSVKERLQLLAPLRKYLLAHGEEIAAEIAKDTGKVLFEAYMTEIFPLVDMLKYYEKHAVSILRPQRRRTPLIFWPKQSKVIYKPIGVVAVIAPWNYPFQLSLIPVLSALIAGNTVILKPSEVTAMTGKLIEQVMQVLNLPKGVIQVLHGGKEVGAALVDSRPDKIFFTGSAATGKKIMATASEHLIPIELELGGKDPMIVLKDANLERAVNGAVWGAFTNSGQVCMSVERVYVHESLYRQFLDRVVEKVETLRQGEGVEAEIGSMTSMAQVEIVRDQLEDARQKGARILTGGGIDGMKIEPTVLTHVNHEMKIMTEETFGPVLPIMSFQTEEEAILYANESPFGLNASVWGNNRYSVRAVASQIESGSVCINDVIVNVANPHLPFGGIKSSGMGRYHGPEGLYSFSHAVAKMEDQGRRKSEINWYPYSQKKMNLLVKLAKLWYGR